MSFRRHEEIYPCGEDNSMETAGRLNQDAEGAILSNHAPAHRNDASPTGYSSVGCSPAVPASASPASAILLRLILKTKDFAVNGKLSLITVSQPWGSLQARRFLVSCRNTVSASGNMVNREFSASLHEMA
jgi:hypothetical protein